MNNLFQKSDSFPQSGSPHPLSRSPHRIFIVIFIAPPLNNNFHVISQKISSCSQLLYYLHFTFVLFAYTGHANFDFNQCLVFTDSCF